MVTLTLTHDVVEVSDATEVTKVPKLQKLAPNLDIKCIIFDLDYTLYNYNTYKLYDGIQDLLYALKNEGYIIALASYNARAEYILKKCDIYKYFNHIEYENVMYYDYCELDDKKSMLETIIKKTCLNHNQLLFIDDQLSNIKTAQSLGFHTLHVDRKTGVHIDMLNFLFKNRV